MKFIRLVNKLVKEYDQENLLSQRDYIEKIAEHEIIAIQKNDLLSLKQKHYFTYQIVIKVNALFSSRKPRIVLLELSRVVNELAKIYKQKDKVDTH